MNTYGENAVPMAAAQAAWLAMLRLSKIGHVVLRFSGAEKTSIEIRDPLQSETPPEIVQRGADTFACIAIWGCRVYWRVDS